MAERLLNQTWGLKTVSPFAIPLSSQEKSLEDVANQLTEHLRQALSISESVASAGTYVTLEWIPLTDDTNDDDARRKNTTNNKKNKRILSRHLHMDIRVEDDAVGQMVLCSPTMRSSISLSTSEGVVEAFSFCCERGTNQAANDAVINWWQSTHGCVFGNNRFCPTEPQIVQTISDWILPSILLRTSKHQQKIQPIDITLTAPSNIRGIDKVTFSVPAASFAALVQEIEAQRPARKRPRTETNNSNNDDDTKEPLPVLRALHHFVWETMHLDLKPFALFRVRSETAVVGCDGRLKVFQRQGLHRVLTSVSSMIAQQITTTTSSVVTMVPPVTTTKPAPRGSSETNESIVAV